MYRPIRLTQAVKRVEEQVATIRVWRGVCILLFVPRSVS